MHIAFGSAESNLSSRLGIDPDSREAAALSVANLEPIRTARRRSRTPPKPRIAVLFLVDFLIDSLFCAIYLAEAVHSNDPVESPIPAIPEWLTTDRPAPIAAAATILAAATIVSRILKSVYAIQGFSVAAVIDVFIALPLIVCMPFQKTRSIYVPYFLRSVVLLKSLKTVIRLRYSFPSINFSPYREKLILLIAYILAIIYLGICAFHFVEAKFAPPEKPPISLMDAFYFIVITISTVGYGDITPSTSAGRAVVIIMIFVSITLLPGLISDLIDTIRVQKSGAGAFSPSASDYVIVCGSFTNIVRVQAVLNAILCRSSSSSTKVVFLARSKPSSQTKALINNSLFKSRVFYLIGSGLDLEDLERVQLRYASAAFILADRYAQSPKEEDEHNTLRAWAFDDYAPHVPLYVDNLLPSTISLQDRTTTASVCLEDIKQTIIAYNCLYPGVGSLLISLLQQSDPVRTDYEDPWRAQYADGITNEIYHSPINPIFVGLSFSTVSYFLYREFQIILFGLGVLASPPPSSRPHRSGATLSRNTAAHASTTHFYRVRLNPGSRYILSEYDWCLFIAQNEEDVTAVRELTKEQFDKSLNAMMEEDRLHDQSVNQPHNTSCKNENDATSRNLDQYNHQRIQQSSLMHHVTRNNRHRFQNFSGSANPRMLVVGEPSTSSIVFSASSQGLQKSSSSTSLFEHIESPTETVVSSLDSHEDVRFAIRSIHRRDATAQSSDTDHPDRFTIADDIERNVESAGQTDTIKDDPSTIYAHAYPTSPYPDDKTPLCWLLISSSSLEDVLVNDARPATDTDVPTSNQTTLSYHILVCTAFTPLTNLFRFICTLRSATIPSTRDLKPILIILSQIPTEEEFAPFAKFPKLYLMVGDPTTRRDLERANVYGADKVVIMNMSSASSYEPSADISGASSTNVSPSDDFFDNSAIMVSHLIYNMFHRMGIRKYVVIELKKRGNIKFLRPTGRKVMRVGASASAVSGFGHGVSSGMIRRYRYKSQDKNERKGHSGGIGSGSAVGINTGGLVALSHPRDVDLNGSSNVGVATLGRRRTVTTYTTPTATATKSVVMTTNVGATHRHHTPPEWSNDVFFAPIFASGRALCTSMIEPVLFQAYHNPFMVEVYKAFCGVTYEGDEYASNNDDDDNDLYPSYDTDEDGVKVCMGDASSMDSIPLHNMNHHHKKTDPKHKRRTGLCHVPVPPHLVNKPFGYLYRYLCVGNSSCNLTGDGGDDVSQGGVIPIGLFREVDPDLGNILPFVVCNPVWSLLVKETDLVYVLM